MKLLKPESVEEIEILEVEKLVRVLTWRNISYDKEQFAPEKLTVIVKCEAAKTLH